MKAALLLFVFISNYYLATGNWIKVEVSPKDFSYRAATWSSVSNVVMVGGSAFGGSIIYSNNQGSSFNKVDIGSYALWDISSKTIDGITYFLTVDDAGKIYGSTDLGINWNLYSSTINSLYGSCIGTNGQAFVSGKNFKLYTSSTSNNFQNWTALPSPVAGPGSFYAISTVDGVNVIAVGTKGVCYSQNSGTSWSQPDSFTLNTHTLYALSHGNASTAMVGGDSFTIAITFNYGETWKKLTVPGATTFSCKFHTVSMLTPYISFVAATANSGSFSVIYKTVDAGNTWLLQTQVNTIIYSLSMFDAKYGVAGTATHGGVYVSVTGFHYYCY
jgi:photosystem II stability/assembly factor-like uncharacterized protein